ncbi:uncharacterized protein LOC105685013 [Athalia rosae]|uniref:uncharacterized protein LOC105685013 n=1 Tax=Athalia rosae TaxID=37344 RepID=UPI002034A59D|nr:uncharacterized protein LOC105685013 [Athalia rosae]
MPKPKKRSKTLGVKSIKSTTRVNGRPAPRPYETEEEAMLRRFHDAQRMARFRAKKKKALEEAQALEASKLAEMTVWSEIRRRNMILQLTEPVIPVPCPKLLQDTPTQAIKQSPAISLPLISGQSKYSQLLGIIEELGRDIRLTYAGSRTSAERVKMGITCAKLLVRDCLLEAEVNSKK